MKLARNVLFGITLAATAGIIIFLLTKKRSDSMLIRIADEGYETANDVLFPDKNIRGKHLRYGPILPE